MVTQVSRALGRSCPGTENADGASSRIPQSGWRTSYCTCELVLVALLLAMFVEPGTAVAAVTPEQREQLAELRKTISSASRYFRARKYDESAEELGEALGLIATLEASDKAGDLERTLKASKTSTENLAKRLKAAGVDVSGTPGGTPGEGAVSFSNDVAPMLVRRCGNCHVSRTRGEFGMPTFEALSEAGVVEPGDSDASHMLELIREGEMPKGGGKLTEEELAALTSWIDAGAKFDGDDPEAPLGTLGESGQPAMVELQQATGDEQVQFSQDLAPVIVENCFPCHAGNQPSARLSLSTFRGILRGGNNDSIVDPSDVAMSLLLRKLRGMEGQRMPLQKPALEPSVIAKFETWISEGAKFDGRDANQPLERMVRMDIASRMSHEELAKQRMGLALDNWRLAKPNEEPIQAETDGLVLVGNVDAERLQQLGELAQQQLNAIAALVRTPAGDPLIKGRATLFVFSRRYDYSELGRMVEKRELSPDWTGHWTYDVIDAYACLLLPRDEEAPLDARLAELLGGLYVESRGVVPAWFSEGSSRAIAARVAARSDEVQEWIAELKDLQGTIDKPDALLGNSLPEAESKLLRFGFVKFLMSDIKRYTRLLESLGEGTEFDSALKEAYGREAPELVEHWVRNGGRRR